LTIDIQNWIADRSGGGRDTREREADNSQSAFGRQRRKFVLLSASHSTRVSTLTTSISGPSLHVDVFHPSDLNVAIVRNIGYV